MSDTHDEVGSLWSRWTKGFRRIRQAPDWQTFAGADWLERIMTVEVTDKLFRKQGRSIARWTLTAPDGRQLVVYLKRHYKLPRKDGWLATLFPRKAWSPGLEEYEHLAWAAQNGLPVPKAMAAGELLNPRGQLQSFIAVAELTNMIGLHEAVPQASKNLDASTFQQWKDSLCDELVRLSLGFHQRHTYHKDWYFCHFYIDEADTTRLPETWENRVQVIDLHRMKRHRFTGPWRKAKDLAQLLFSSDVLGVTDADRQRFWQKYKAHIGVPWFVAWLAKQKWKIYRRKHAAKG